MASARMHGSVFAQEVPRVFESFIEVLSEKPAFSVLVVNAPIGFLETPEMGARTCDREVREILGRRGAAVHNAPSRAVLRNEITWHAGGIDAVTATLLPRYREVAADMSPFRQRVVFEGHPELSFFQLNRDNPLGTSKKIEPGLEERSEILESRMPGILAVLKADVGTVPTKHLFDVAAMLWTARRILVRAAKRIPADPEWDSEGLRMEIVY